MAIIAPKAQSPNSFCCRHSNILKATCIFIGIWDVFLGFYVIQNNLKQDSQDGMAYTIQMLCLLVTILSVICLCIGVLKGRHRLLMPIFFNEAFNLFCCIGMTSFCLIGYYYPEGYCGEYIGDLYSSETGILLGLEEIQTFSMILAIIAAIATMIYTLFNYTIYKCYNHIRNHQIPPLSFEMSLEHGPRVIST